MRSALGCGACEMSNTSNPNSRTFAATRPTTGVTGASAMTDAMATATIANRGETYTSVGDLDLRHDPLEDRVGGRALQLNLRPNEDPMTPRGVDQRLHVIGGHEVTPG